MPEPIGREEVRRLVAEEAAQVMEVSSRSAYDWAHLPGAVHLGFQDMEPVALRDRLSPSDPVVVYSTDYY